MSTIRLLLSLCALGVLSLIPGARTQDQECPVIQTQELGSTSAGSTTGLISQSYTAQAGDNPPRPIVQLFESNIVCLAAGRTQGRYRLVSLIANFSCSGSACNNNNAAWQIAQFHFDCRMTGAWTASVAGSTDFLITESPVGNLSTMLRRDCSICVEPQQIPSVDVDETTHCRRECANSYTANLNPQYHLHAQLNKHTHCTHTHARTHTRTHIHPHPHTHTHTACSTLCIGTGTCFSPRSEDCCNFYDMNGACATECPMGEVPDDQFQCSGKVNIGCIFSSFTLRKYLPQYYSTNDFEGQPHSW